METRSAPLPHSASTGPPLDTHATQATRAGADATAAEAAGAAEGAAEGAAAADAVAGAAADAAADRRLSTVGGASPPTLHRQMVLSSPAETRSSPD